MLDFDLYLAVLHTVGYRGPLSLELTNSRYYLVQSQLSSRAWKSSYSHRALGTDRAQANKTRRDRFSDAGANAASPCLTGQQL
jgi:sugar phosphate isomerase/epimerase